MSDHLIDEQKKIIAELMKIGVKISDNQIEKVAENLFDKNSDFEQSIKNFVKDIHRILGE